jgi:acetyl-CoA C-acetyltransferase
MRGIPTIANPTTRTVILGSARTPIAKLGGGLATVDAPSLGGFAMAAALERAGVAPEQIEHVVMGTVLQAGQGQIPSRQAQHHAGIPVSVSSETINKVCASGMRSVALLDTAIRAGDLTVGLGGGMESMSMAPYLAAGTRFGLRMGDATASDAMLRDGLVSPWSGRHMLVEATEVAAELEVGREEMDRWAVRSHARAIAAIDDGRIGEEIVSVTVRSDRAETVIESDEAPRRDATLAALAKLAAVFVVGGTHTAGNSPGVSDGAAAIVVAADAWATANGREPLATIVATAQAADDFRYLARTPALAAHRALEKAGLQASSIDLWEINEAFASVALQSVRMLGIDEDRVNVNGGAVAYGHPIGASGARILATLVHELRRRGGGLGCAAICSGGAQGDAVIVAV